MVRKVVLVILDGYGVNEPKNETILKGDATKRAHTPNMNFLYSNYPSTLLFASGEHVGLTKNQMGNSEVGHLTIGAGRVIQQDCLRITDSINQKTFKTKITSLMKNEKGIKGHIIGLLSDGGVHSHITIIKEIIRTFPRDEVYLHAILDGRDTEPKKAVKFLKEILNYMKSVGKGKLASISGRFYTMDRDNNWDRIDMAFKMMTGDEYVSDDPIKVIEDFYANGVTDEFVKPVLLIKSGKIDRQDTVLIANFRADRARQITEKFNHRNCCYTLTDYGQKMNTHIIFRRDVVNNTLTDIISRNNLKQLHLAETEKYAHVTYFFNGGKEQCVDGEERHMIHSKKVESFDKAPEMRTIEIAKATAKFMENDYSFIVCNIAAPDMVGHTGNFEATVKAIEIVDEAIGIIYRQSKNTDFTMILTADHGNAEVMVDEKGDPVKKHTCNKVPFILCDGYISDWRKSANLSCSLKDVAPTILKFMGLEIPNQMKGIDMADLYRKR